MTASVSEERSTGLFLGTPAGTDGDSRERIPAEGRFEQADVVRWNIRTESRKPGWLRLYIPDRENLEDTLSLLIETIKKQGASMRDIHVERAGIEARFFRDCQGGAR